VEPKSIQWLVINYIVPAISFLLLTGATWVYSHARVHSSVDIATATSLAIIETQVKSINGSIAKMDMMNNDLPSKQDMLRLESKIDKLLK
jgi:hypothetical protein